MGRKKLEDKDKKKAYNIMLSDKEVKTLENIAKSLGLDSQYVQTRSKTISSIIERFSD